MFYEKNMKIGLSAGSLFVHFKDFFENGNLTNRGADVIQKLENVTLGFLIVRRDSKISEL